MFLIKEKIYNMYTTKQEDTKILIKKSPHLQYENNILPLFTSSDFIMSEQ